jgi:hypothetical protein
MVVRTQVEVVVLSITDDNEECYRVPDSYIESVQYSICSCIIRHGDSRAADGFLPKYLAWYRPRSPLGLAAGAAPRGSFS